MLLLIVNISKFFVPSSCFPKAFVNLV